MSYERYKDFRLAPDDNGCWDVLNSDYEQQGTYPSHAAAKRAIDEMTAQPTTTNQEELEKWLVGRPQIVKDIARKYPPWEEFVHKGHPDTATYQVHSINEDGTVTCNKLDFLGIPMQVFGMNPSDLIAPTPVKKGSE